MFCAVSIASPIFHGAHPASSGWAFSTLLFPAESIGAEASYMWNNTKSVVEAMNDERWRDCAELLVADRPPPLHAVVRDPWLAAALVETVQKGGVAVHEILRPRMASRAARLESTPLHSWPSRVFNALGASAEHAFKVALARQQWNRLPVLFVFMLRLPVTDGRLRRRIVRCHRAFLREIVTLQSLIVDSFNKEPLDSSRFDADIVRQYVSTTRMFTVGAEMLTDAAKSDRYPTLGADLLSATLRVAQWPVLAFVGQEVELLYSEHLNEWFLNPSSSARFTEQSRRWLKYTVCAEAEDGADRLGPDDIPDE